MRLPKFVILLVLIPTFSPAQGEHAHLADSLSTPPVNDFVVYGSVVLPSGRAPGRLVEVQRICAGRTLEGTYADAKGRFRFRIDLEASASDLRTCSIRASLDGYHPQAIALDSFVNAYENLGKLVLQPIGRHASVMSVTDMEVPKNARKDYEAGLDAAARTQWAFAISVMKKATAAYRKFATAWLSLGILEAEQKDFAAAQDSYTQAITADNKFAPAYVELAALQVATGQWSQAAESAGKATALDPDAFPSAYYLAAAAELRLNRSDAAEKDVAAGLRVDPDHELPDLEYLDGIMRLGKGDLRRGREQLESYLSHAPDGMNAADARQQLGEKPQSK